VVSALTSTWPLTALAALLAIPAHALVAASARACRTTTLPPRGI
jgi:hypothetical protein